MMDGTITFLQKIMFKKLPRRFKNRVKLIFSAIFSTSSDLEKTMASISKPKDMLLRSWGNPYDILTKLLPQYDRLDNDILQLTDSESNPESSEADVVSLLYNVIRQTKSKTAIEIGVYHGAASLSIAQGIDKNGGGEVHLVDTSKEFLQDVSRKISQKNWQVTVHQHHIKTNKKTGVTGLPKTDILFIDAAHTFEAVKNDLRQYQPFISPGGFLILHDTIRHEGPRRVVAEMFEKGLKGCSFATSRGSGVTIFQY